MRFCDLYTKIGRCIFGHLLVFRKDLCEAKRETQSVLKFSDVPFALKSDGPPPVDEALGQVDFFVRSLGQTDLWSDLSPSRGI